MIGNEPVADLLASMRKKNRIPNSMLFSGPDGVGKKGFALSFAKELLNSRNRERHPDIRLYRPEGKSGMHSIETLRQFSEEVYLAPFEAQRKVFIIEDADRMFTASANALLKTFEEPAPHSVIILTSGNPQAIRPTILSRCSRIHFQRVPKEAIGSFIREKYSLSEKEAERIAAVAAGSVANACSIAEKGDHPMRKLLLDTLAGGTFSTYRDFMEFIKTLTGLIDAEKETQATLLKDQQQEEMGKEITAIQKESFQKEQDGAAAMTQSKEITILFDVLLSWYRDLELLASNGRSELLLHPDYEEAERHVLKIGRPLSIEYVQECLADTGLSLSRSTSLGICLENLFLRLNFV